MGNIYALLFFPIRSSIVDTKTILVRQLVAVIIRYLTLYVRNAARAGIIN